MKKFLLGRVEGDGDFQCGNSPDFSGCWILTESQEFIRRTFSFLPAKSLGICSRVCKAWHTEVKRVLQHREEIGWATFGRVETKEFGCVTSHTTEDQLGPFGAHLNACLETLGSLPRHVIVFSECLLSDQQRFHRGYLEIKADATRRRVRKSLEEVCSRLPGGSSVIFVHSDGTMGCKPDLRPAGETNGDFGTACVLLPSMRDVVVDCQRHTLTRSQTAVAAQDRMPADTKCVLVFHCGGPRQGARFVEFVQRGFYEKFGTMPVFAGGIALNVFVDDQTGANDSGPNSRNVPTCLTLTFSGPNVRAASVVLDRTVTTRAGVCAKLRELKKSGLPTQRSLAFAFSCVGRGPQFYQAEDVESGAFHEVFPDTPLLGFFGGGEYGCDNFTLGRAVRGGDDDDSPGNGPSNAHKQKLPKLEKAFTCVVCLLSFG